MSSRSSTVHAVAQVGFGVGTNEQYDSARPSYQITAISHIHSVIERKNSLLNVIEIGAGTGIFTRALLAHPEWSSSINQIKAFEPSPGMRQVFSDKVKDDRVSIAEGFFDKVDVEDSWADVIFIAQAFHWCLDYEKAAQEFSRVLKTNGTLALLWNLENKDAARWVAKLRERIEKHELGTPQFRLGLWREIYDAPSFIKSFNPAQERTWSFNLPGTVDNVVARALSKSYTTILSDEAKNSIAEDIKHILNEGQDLVWTDQSHGVFEYPYTTVVVTTNKK